MLDLENLFVRVKFDLHMSISVYLVAVAVMFCGVSLSGSQAFKWHKAFSEGR